MAMTRKHRKQKIIDNSDFFIIQVFKNNEKIFYEYYKTFEQANEAFGRVRAAVEHQVARALNTWTNNIYKAWKEKDPNFEKIKRHLEGTWNAKYGLNQPLDKLYKGDVWNNFNACLRFRFLKDMFVENKEDLFLSDDVISRFYVYGLTFDTDKQNSYCFRLLGTTFSKDVDEPRKWISKEGIKSYR